MTKEDELFSKLGKYQTEAKEMRDIHLAFISVFHGGSSESYLRSIHAEINYLEKECNCDTCKNRILTLKLRRNFVVEYIPPKIKWNKINCNN